MTNDVDRWNKLANECNPHEVLLVAFRSVRLTVDRLRFHDNELIGMLRNYAQMQLDEAPIAAFSTIVRHLPSGLAPLKSASEVCSPDDSGVVRNGFSAVATWTAVAAECCDVRWNFTAFKLRFIGTA